MKTCEACKKPFESDNPHKKYCDLCELVMLQATAEAALRDYVNKVNEIIKKAQLPTSSETAAVSG